MDQQRIKRALSRACGVIGHTEEYLQGWTLRDILRRCAKLQPNFEVGSWGWTEDELDTVCVPKD